MSERVKAFIVTLEGNLRQEDADHVAAAIALLSGVVEVTAVPSKGIDDYIARAQVKRTVVIALREAADKILQGAE